MPSDKDEQWKVVTEYGVMTYQCGLTAGESVRLRRDLMIRQHTGEVMHVIPAGQIWTVLTGSRHDPGIVWFRKPNGSRHTWDDEEGLFDWFERIEG